VARARGGVPDDRLDLDAAVDCYGAYVVGDPAEEHPMHALGLRGFEEQLPKLGCPLLGLFGNDDAHPSPDEVASLDTLLTEHGKDHEFHAYDGAGHAFFATDRPSYRVEAAGVAWARRRSTSTIPSTPRPSAP
jgi:carboxymethylenebutenolidase